MVCQICQVILDAGFVQSPHDFSFFPKNSQRRMTFLLIYVDDILVTSEDKEGVHISN